jgi:hypothetical protein
MQFGTNHLGPFAFTGALLDKLLASGPSRVVTVSSMMHMPGKIRFADPTWQTGYSRWPAYCMSKVANLLFMRELQRRLVQTDSDTISLACHPGYASTHLQERGPQMDGSKVMEQMWGAVTGMFAQSAAMGALPTLYAAVSHDVKGGDYIGPNTFGAWGYPTKVSSTPYSKRQDEAARLWALSEELTGVSYAAFA